MYVDAELRPKVGGLLAQVSTGEASVFEFERFLSHRSWAPVFFLEWIATASRGALGLAVGCGIIAIYFYLRFALPKLGWDAYEIWLLAIDSLILIGDLMIAFFIARIRYSYLRQSYYKRA